jgi:hypothetical protein
MPENRAFKRGCDLDPASRDRLRCVSCERAVQARAEARDAGWQDSPLVCPDCLRWAPVSEQGLRIERRGRFWSVYDREELICVTVYRKGARAVVARLGSS